MFGISILLNYLWELNIGMVFILLNIPVFLLALKVEVSFFTYGVLGAFCSGLMINFLSPLGNVFQLPIISSVVIGGIIVGIGVGTMLRHHISPGGMDLLALLFAKWSKINVGIIAYVMDTILILTSLIILQEPRFLYSLLIVSIVGMLATIITSYNSKEIEE